MIRLIPSWAVNYEAFWDAIRKRNMWFIKLRYGAVIMLSVFIFLSEILLGFKYTNTQTTALFIITFSILFYNIVIHVAKKYVKSIAGRFNPLHLSTIQMLFDITALFLLVYITGGIETPLYMLFVFHMIIGSLILPGKVMYSVAAFVILCFGGLIFLEYYHVIPHHAIKGFLYASIYDDFNYMVSILTVFSFMIIVSVYLANGIARQLYKMEQDLIESLDRLSTAEIEKQKYIVSIVHEIKTPLTAVHSYLNLILKKFLGPLDEKVEEKLIRANLRSEEAINLINNVIKISRFKLFDQFSKEEIKIEDVMLELSEKHLAAAEAKKIKLTFNDKRASNSNIIGDRFLFTLAISNLIGNAIKYVNKNGLIEVNVENENSNLKISVCDNGIGIPENEKEKIFKEFFRSSNVSKEEHEGTGIGLSIVKEIIEKHGGSISVESPSRLQEMGKPGTCFSVVLPCS